MSARPYRVQHPLYFKAYKRLHKITTPKEDDPTGGASHRVELEGHASPKRHSPRTSRSERVRDTLKYIRDTSRDTIPYRACRKAVAHATPHTVSRLPAHNVPFDTVVRGAIALEVLVVGVDVRVARGLEAHLLM